MGGVFVKVSVLIRQTPLSGKAVQACNCGSQSGGGGGGGGCGKTGGTNKCGRNPGDGDVERQATTLADIAPPLR